jgi:hypothetical protein
MTPSAPEPARPVSFDAADGSILIGGFASRIGAGLRTTQLPEDLASLVISRRDMGTGWTWTTFAETTLEGHPCELSLGAFHGTLSEVSWSVSVADGQYAGGWPSPETTAKEIDLLIGILTRAFGPGQLPGRGSGERARYGRDFPWGSVWCGLDPRAGTSSSGLRYTTQA